MNTAAWAIVKTLLNIYFGNSGLHNCHIFLYSYFKFALFLTLDYYEFVENMNFTGIDPLNKLLIDFILNMTRIDSILVYLYIKSKLKLKKVYYII